MVAAFNGAHKRLSPIGDVSPMKDVPPIALLQIDYPSPFSMGIGGSPQATSVIRSMVERVEEILPI